MVYIRGQSFKENVKGGVFILEDKGKKNMSQKRQISSPRSQTTHNPSSQKTVTQSPNKYVWIGGKQNTSERG